MEGVREWLLAMVVEPELSPMTTKRPNSISRYVALLRAVNVGGTGKLPMADLAGMCTKLGFANVRTYIASGNVVFESAKSVPEIQYSLETRLEKYAGKPVGVLVRTADEMAQVLAQNPFPKAPKSRVLVFFLPEVIAAKDLENVSGRASEELALGAGLSSARELYVLYPEGQGSSRLKIAAAAKGTGRNMNTVAKLAQWLVE